MRWHNGIVRLRAERAAVGFVQATITGDTADVAWLIGVPWQRRGIAIEAAPYSAVGSRPRGSSI